MASPPYVSAVSMTRQPISIAARTAATSLFRRAADSPIRQVPRPSDGTCLPGNFTMAVLRREEEDGRSYDDDVHRGPRRPAEGRVARDADGAARFRASALAHRAVRIDVEQ